MSVEIIRCLQDNYAFLLIDPDGGVTLIDAPEAAPILERLHALDLRLSRILITHHHWDHVGGLDEVLAQHPVPVLGAAADAHRLPPLTHALAPGDTLPGGGVVMDAPGHTLGHVAFYYSTQAALFSADSLMTHGCGRLFEGTADDMFDTIARFALLPDETRVFSGHDYAAGNLAFAARFAPDPQALAERRTELPWLAGKGLPTTGTTLASEKRLNPYLRCHLPEVAAAAGLPDAAPRAVLAEIRRQKDTA